MSSIPPIQVKLVHVPLNTDILLSHDVLHNDATKSSPLPPILYQTPGWPYEVPQVANPSVVALTVVPCVVELHAILSALQASSFAGGVGGGGILHITLTATDSSTTFAPPEAT